MPLLGLVANALAGYVGLVAALYMVSPAVARAGFVARVLAAYATLVAVALVGVVASALLTLAGRQSIAQWFTARAFHLAMRCSTGVAFAVDDPADVLASTRPAVFVGNHQSELDVLMLGAMFPKHCSVTAKSDLRHVPFLGWFMRLSGAIFIDRRNSRDAREAMQGAAREMQLRRQSVYMFPEGTRSYSKEPTLLPFKKGAFHLAVQAGVPIVPCVVANYSHVLYIKDMVFTSGTIPVKVLDPIPTTGLTAADVDDLARTTHDLMLKELVALSAKAKGQPLPVPAGAPKPTGSGVETGPSDASRPRNREDRGRGPQADGKIRHGQRN